MKNDNELWVIFRLDGILYAIKSSCVQGVFREPERLTDVPESQSYVKGIIQEREKILTLVELRSFFGINTLKQEYQEFDGIIETAEAAHKKWVSELYRCACDCCAFTMEKNPHHCAFGRWYDKYEAPIETVQKRMEKIRQPHYNLHHLGVEFDNEMAKGNPDTNRLRQLANEAKEIEKKILATMDAARETYRESFRTMVIELNLPEGNIGLVVDEIVGVEQIGTIFEDSTLEKMERSELIGTVANTSNNKDLLFLIDENQVSKLLVNINGQHDELVY